MTATEQSPWVTACILWRHGVESADIAAGFQRKGITIAPEAIEQRAWDDGWKRSKWPAQPPVHCPNCGESVVKL